MPVDERKVKSKLPSLLLDRPVMAIDSEYMKKRRSLCSLQKKKPDLFYGLMNNIFKALDELDKEAEQVGFQHVDFDSRSNLVRKPKSR